MILNHVPVEGEIVYAPSFHVRGYTKITGGANAEHDKRLFEQGLLFPTTEDAIAETGRIYNVLAVDKLRTEEALQEEKAEDILSNEKDSEAIFPMAEEVADEEHDFLEEPLVVEDGRSAQDSTEALTEQEISTEQVDESIDSAIDESAMGMFARHKYRRRREMEEATTTVKSESISEPPVTEDVSEEVEDFSSENRACVASVQMKDIDEEKLREAEAYQDCADLFDIQEELFVHGTSFSPAVRVSGGILLDRVERAREQFIEETSKNGSRADSAEAFVDLVESIPENSRAKILSIMGPQQFATMMARFYAFAKEGM